jgi:hypothetical protein
LHAFSSPAFPNFGFFYASRATGYISSSVGGIRILRSVGASVSYRFLVAEIAIVASAAVAHCQNCPNPNWPDGQKRSTVKPLRMIAESWSATVWSILEAGILPTNYSHSATAPKYSKSIALHELYR